MEANWVVLGAGDPHIFYVGKTSLDKWSLRKHIESGTPVELTDARVVEYQAGVMMGPQGPGISIRNNVWPLPLTQGTGTVHVKAQIMFHPDDIPELTRTLDDLITHCQELETQMRAKSAGLVAATAIPQGPRRQ